MVINKTIVVDLFQRIYHNVLFCTNKDAWEDADMQIIPYVLKSVIKEFECVGLDLNNLPVLFIEPTSSSNDSPILIRTDDYQRGIELSARSNYWCQYVYQFAHEYCHFIVDSPFDGKFITSFWFEESICELASLYVLQRLSVSWRQDDIKEIRRFSPWVEDYLQEHLNDIPTLETSLYDWINSHMDILSEECYHRELYAIIAKKLFSVFCEHPNLWNILPYLKRPDQYSYMNFDYWLFCSVKEQMPDSLSQDWYAFEKEFFD